MFLTTKALVLREVRYRESDKILTVLTENEGKLTVNARGALRRGSRIGAASQQMTYSEMTLFKNRGKWTLREAETIEQFSGLRQDLAALALGGYVVELLEATADEDSPNPALLKLGLNTLYALSHRLFPLEHSKAVFELRLMCLAGFEPNVFACPVCDRQMPEDPRFSLRGGTIHCCDCMPGAPGLSLPLCAASLAAMRYIVTAPPKKVFSFTTGDPEAEQRLYAVCEAYVTAQLERTFGTLDYWKTVR